MGKQKRIIILTRGLQGSGKSTWAKAWVAEKPEARIRWNNDDIRNMYGPYMMDNAKEKIIIKMLKSWTKLAMESGFDIVIDNMNLGDSPVARIQAIINEYNASNSIYEYSMEFKDFFDIPVSECIRRDAMRPNPIGAAVIKKTWKQHRNKIIAIVNNELVNKQNQFEYAQSHLVNECIIADMDSTICFNTTGREFFGKNASEKMADDVPNKSVISIIRQYLNNAKPSDKVFIITGRTGDGDTIKVTEEYVKNHIADDPRIIVIFRDPNDKVSGDAYKINAYNTYIKDKYKVLYAIDDSNKVVTAYRNIGMSVLQPYSYSD